MTTEIITNLKVGEKFGDVVNKPSEADVVVMYIHTVFRIYSLEYSINMDKAHVVLCTSNGFHFETNCVSLTLMNYLCTSRKLNVSCNLK